MSKRCFSLVVFLLIVSLFMVTTQCSRDSRTIAQIGAHERIVSIDFEKSLAAFIGKQNPDTISLELVKDHLNEQIESRLILLAAYDEKMDQDSVMLDRMKEIKRRALIDELWQKEVVDFVVSEKEIRDFYAKSDIRVDARRIDLYVDAKADSTEEAAVLARVRELIQKIKEGEPFSRIARQYSDDRQTARKGGQMEPLWYRLDKDPIVEAAFNMKKGEISEPIRTTAGYAILIVDDIQEVNKRTYKEAYEGMKKYILETKNEEANERARAYMDTLWARQDATWNEENIDTLTAWFRQWKKGHDQLILIDSLRALPEDVKNRMVFTSKEQNFSVADLLAYYKKSLAQYNRLAMENKSSFKRVLVTDLRYRLLEDQAMRDRLDQDEKLIRQIKEKFENELINKKRTGIQSKVQPTEDELKAWYEANKASKYMTPKQVEIQEILVRSENLASELLQRIKAGEDFGTLAEKYTLRKGQKEKKGMIAPFGKGAMGAVGEKAFQMAVGEIAGPIPSTDNKQAIIKLINIREPEPRSYADVASIVQRDFINDVRKKQITDWAVEQKEKRGVYINEQLVESIWKSYASKK